MHITQGCPFSCSLHTFKETKHFDQSLTLKKNTTCKFQIFHSPLNHPVPVQILHFAQYQVMNLDTPLKQLKHLPAKVKNRT